MEWNGGSTGYADLLAQSWIITNCRVTVVPSIALTSDEGDLPNTQTAVESM